jgi:hypothetical protein
LDRPKERRPNLFPRKNRGKEFAKALAIAKTWATQECLLVERTKSVYSKLPEKKVH